MPHIPRGSEKESTNRKYNKQARRYQGNTKEKHGQFVPSGVASYIEGRPPLRIAWIPLGTYSLIQDKKGRS